MSHRRRRRRPLSANEAIVEVPAGVIAVFGDVHGQLEGMYELCRSWEDETGQAIAAILQTGDLGIFPDPVNLDRATRRHAERDPSELGAADYLSGSTIPRVPALFVRGNHEDFDFLIRFPDGGAVDLHHRLILLESSRPWVLDVGGCRVSVAGLGGIAPGPRARSREQPRPGRRYFTEGECRALLGLSRPGVDVLLTHEAPQGRGLRGNADTGAAEVSRAIQQLRPRFHFFGHYHDPPPPFTLGRTLCVGMNSRYARRIPGRDGAMGILRPDPWSFELVPPRAGR